MMAFLHINAVMRGSAVLVMFSCFLSLMSQVDTVFLHGLAGPRQVATTNAGCDAAGIYRFFVGKNPI